MKKKPFRALGVYIFAGGFTVGVRKEFDVLAHLEDGTYGVETFKKNHPVDIPVHTDPGSWPLSKFKRVDFVYANPPCAPWSTASHGRATHWRDDPRVNCVRNAFKVLEELRPKVWCFESVAATFNKGKELRDELENRALKMGYSVTHLLHEGSRLGLPQKRNRYFMIAHRIELEIEEPNFKTVTVRDAFKGIKPDEHGPLGHITKLVKAIKPGCKARDVFNKKFAGKFETRTFSTGRKVIRGRPSFQVMRLLWDAISPTLTGGGNKLHPEEHRYISIAEQAALCGYPRGYKFIGPISSRYAQTAQCVTPPVGNWITKEVKRALELNKRVRNPEARIIDVRKTPMKIYKEIQDG